MNRKRRILFVIAGAALAGILAIAYKQLAPNFTLYLNCNGSNLGILTVAQETQAGTFRKMQQIDLAVACKAGNVKMSGYRRENSLRFTLLGEHAEKADLIAEYGRDIQSDRDAFYTVLKVADTPPYLTNDRI